MGLRIKGSSGDDFEKKKASMRAETPKNKKPTSDDIAKARKQLTSNDTEESKKGVKGYSVEKNPDDDTFVNFKDGALGERINELLKKVKNVKKSTAMLGEEGGDVATTKAVGEEGGTSVTYALGEGGGNATTQAVGEEGGTGRLTTAALGEEGGDTVTTKSVGEEGGTSVTYALGENGDGGAHITTMALGEEGGDIVTTKSVGEEGGTSVTYALGENGDGGGHLTTMAVGEEGGDSVTYALGEGGDSMTSRAACEEGGDAPAPLPDKPVKPPVANPELDIEHEQTEENVRTELPRMHLREGTWYTSHGYVNEDGSNLTEAERRMVQKALKEEENMIVGVDTNGDGKFDGRDKKVSLPTEITLPNGKKVRIAPDAHDRIMQLPAEDGGKNGKYGNTAVTRINNKYYVIDKKTKGRIAGPFATQAEAEAAKAKMKQQSAKRLK